MIMVLFLEVREMRNIHRKQGKKVIMIRTPSGWVLRPERLRLVTWGSVYPSLIDSWKRGRKMRHALIQISVDQHFA
jgi:hypothetical protein